MEFNATFIVTAISFVVFTLIMNWIFYKPIENIIKKRENFIDETLKCADKTNNEADSIIQNREASISKSISDSKKIVAEKTQKANSDASLITKTAKEKASENISNAKKDLQTDAAKLSKNMNSEIDKLAQLIVSKVMEN